MGQIQLVMNFEPENPNKVTELEIYWSMYSEAIWWTFWIYHNGHWWTKDTGTIGVIPYFMKWKDAPNQAELMLAEGDRLRPSLPQYQRVINEWNYCVEYFWDPDKHAADGNWDWREQYRKIREAKEKGYL